MTFNFILDEYPLSVIVEEVEYTVNTDFKIILAIIQLLSDDLFTNEEKVLNSLSLFYAEDIPKNSQEAYQELLAFISMYKENINDNTKQAKLMDYEIDSGAINVAFIQNYGIELNTATMHWFKFNNMMENLSDGKPRLLNLIEIRDMKIDDKLDPQTKIKLRKLKKEYSLETEQDVSASFADAFLFGARGGVGSG